MNWCRLRWKLARVGLRRERLSENVHRLSTCNVPRRFPERRSEHEDSNALCQTRLAESPRPPGYERALMVLPKYLLIPQLAPRTTVDRNLVVSA